MARFRVSLAVCLLMALAVPFPDMLAVSRQSPAYTHFVYVIGHAGWFHWLVNSWTLLVLHNLLRWYRIAAAYLWAVLESFMMLPGSPMVGLSVFNCFFIGFAAPWLWRRDRLTVLLTLALLLLTCVVSGFAGVQHVASFCFGALFYVAEMRLRSLSEYLKG